MMPLHRLKGATGFELCRNTFVFRHNSIHRLSIRVLPDHRVSNCRETNQNTKKPCGARLIERADMDRFPSAACTRGDVWTSLEAVCLFASVRHIDVAIKLIQEVAGLHPAA